MRPRDSQQGKVYRANRAANDRLALPPLSLAQIKSNLDELEHSRWMRNRFPALREGTTFAVLPGRTQAAFRCYEPGMSAVNKLNHAPTGAWWCTTGFKCWVQPTPGHATALDTLHVACHYAVLSPNGGTVWPPWGQRPAMHGPEFCRLLLQMVQQFIGPEAADVLREEYKAQRVKARVVSPEARAAARLRAQGRDLANQLNDKSPLIPKTNQRAHELIELNTQLNGTST